jgi:hypothetical protein
MTALTQEKMRSFERWTYHLFPLAAGTKAFKHGAIGIDRTTGKVKPAAAGATLLMIGIAAETVDATAGEKLINVNLGTEIEVEWWANAGGITAANVGSIAYFADDQTVTITAGGMTAGRIWAVEGARVAVENLRMRGDVPAPPLQLEAPPSAAREYEPAPSQHHAKRGG